MDRCDTPLVFPVDELVAGRLAPFDHHSWAARCCEEVLVAHEPPHVGSRAVHPVA
jgi:hypothetical protein